MATSKQTIYDPIAGPHTASDDYCESNAYQRSACNGSGQTVAVLGQRATRRPPTTAP